MQVLDHRHVRDRGAELRGSFEPCAVGAEQSETLKDTPRRYQHEGGPGIIDQLQEVGGLLFMKGLLLVAERTRKLAMRVLGAGVLDLHAAERAVQVSDVG
jgi:hypothetical protein